jgi:hypothetical protein
VKFPLKLLLTVLLGHTLLASCALAQSPATDEQAGRYVLLVVGGANVAYQRSYMITKTPALVLDSFLGIVWRCKNLQDDRPAWIKTELVKNKVPSRLAKKYIIKTIDYFGSEPKVPAVVLDVEEGKVWTCSDILDDVAPWIEKDLVQGAKDEKNKYKY